MPSDSTNFSFTGFIPEAMLVNVPTDNVIVNEYHKLPASGVRPIPKELKKGLEEGKKNPNGVEREN